MLEVMEMEILASLTAKIANHYVKIVFPEGSDERIITAASRLAEDHLLTPILLGETEVMLQQAQKLGVDLAGCVLINPQKFADLDRYAEALYERRKGKMTIDEAQKLVRDVNYFGTMMVYLGEASGMVSGAIHSTGETVRPALQIIKTKPNISRVSGAFLMMRGDEKYIFADCAINVNPSAQELAEIALESAKTAEMFDIKPNVALLSFSTDGSAQAPEVTKVTEAVQIVQDLNTNPNYHFDGEMQFDAAINQKVAQLKMPNSQVAGDAKVFIFPSLEAGNIGYKIAQRLGNFEAVGPILQGLNAPVSDLSRGCNADEVYKLSLITAAQAIMK